MSEPYDTIAQEAYSRFLASSVTNAKLRDYYNACFQSSIDHFGAYQCWACVNCLKLGRKTQEWGEPPATCPQCRSTAVYEIGTFQARASKVGYAFSSAFSYLMKTHFRLPLDDTPGNTRTHDLEIATAVAIEAKGSPASFMNPNGKITHLGRPGMERSDTRKKAFANADTYRRQNAAGLFFVVSNAVPSDLVGYRGDNLTAIFDATKVDRLKAMVTEISDKVDLEALRANRGLSSSS